MTIAPECYERFLNEASKKFFKLIKEKEYRQALKLEKEYSLFKFFKSFCNNISKKDNTYMYDSLKTIKLLNSNVPKILKNLDVEILNSLRKDLMIDYFFDNKVRKYIPVNILSTGIKYDYKTCLVLYKHYINQKIKLDYNNKQEKEIYGEDNTVYIVDNNSCEHYSECPHKDKFYMYKELPELPLDYCKKVDGCNCFYRWH